MAYILEVSSLRREFGGLVAINGLDFKTKPGEIMSIIGPNGAGKTTLFNIISGFLSPSGGKIIFKGTAINSVKPHEIAHLGVARTFQNLALFGQMSVLENVMSGFHKNLKATFVTAGIRLRAVKNEEREVRRKSVALLQIFHLENLADDLASNLPYGKQKLVEMTRALASDPELLLLDEPAAGLNQHEAEEILQMIRKVQDRGVTVLLVEHNVRLVMKISERIVVLNNGVKIAEGTPGEIRRDERVITAYLGDTL
jgi:branched-chain amino acid transport system ATP-binding protein